MTAHSSSRRSSSNSDRAKLAAGAAEIRRAERESRELVKAKPGRLDGTLEGARQKLIQLHNEIFAEARTSFKKAVEMGRLLVGIRRSYGIKGKWEQWVSDNLPFDV
jgi:hypothetical protein